jgi:hypothetical protein
MQQWGSFIVSGVPAIGLFLAGRNRYIGWFICLVGQVLWAVYGTFTGQWGMAAWAPVYTLIYAWNLIRWRKQEKERENGGSPPA